MNLEPKSVQYKTLLLELLAPAPHASSLCKKRASTSLLEQVVRALTWSKVVRARK